MTLDQVVEQSAQVASWCAQPHSGGCRVMALYGCDHMCCMSTLTESAGAWLLRALGARCFSLWSARCKSEKSERERKASFQSGVDRHLIYGS